MPESDTSSTQRKLKYEWVLCLEIVIARDHAAEDQIDQVLLIGPVLEPFFCFVD